MLSVALASLVLGQVSLCPNVVKGREPPLPGAVLDQPGAVKLAKEVLAEARKRLFIPDRKRAVEKLLATPTPALGTSAPALVLAGMHEEGLTLLAASAIATPRDAKLMSNLGEALAIGRDTSRAVSFLRWASELDKDNPVPLVNLGVIAFRLGNFAIAGSYFDRALALQPEFDEANLGKASIATCQGKPEEAAAFLAKVKSRFADKAVILRAGGKKPDPPPDRPRPEPRRAAPGSPGAPKDEIALDLITGPVPRADVDLGFGTRPNFLEGPPGESEVLRMLELRPSLRRYARVAQELAESSAKRSKDFETELNHIHTALNWSERPYVAIMVAKGKYERAIQTLENQRRKNPVPHPPQRMTSQDYERKRSECADEACLRAVTTMYCKARLADVRENWTVRYTNWNSDVIATNAALSDFYARVSDATYHWLDKSKYQRAQAWVQAELWRTLANEAYGLLSLSESIPPEIKIEKPDWCDTTTPPPPEEDEKPGGPSLFPSLEQWCPDWLKVSIDTPLGGFTIGCNEVSLEVSEGAVTAMVSYAWKGTFTAKVTVGHSWKDAVKAEASATLTVTANGIEDVVGEAELSVAGKASAKTTVSAANRTVKGEVILIGRTVAEAEGTWSD